MYSPRAMDRVRSDLARHSSGAGPDSKLLKRIAAEPGREIDEYVLMEELGHGSSGAVWKAWDRNLHRWVAVKRLGCVPSATVRERFLREARAAARIRHPNIVTVYGAGEAAGVPYIVMELIEGAALNTAGALRATVSHLRTVARALQQVHSAGLVHRDLKPANILVDSAGQPHVVDFGLAYSLDGCTRLTNTGGIVGTPLYMAPEQVSDRFGGIDSRTDVYALGVILYEALRKRPPHTAKIAATLYHKILEVEPSPPGGPADLATICQRAMEKSPDRRYPSAGAMADELDRWLSGEPILARPQSAPERLKRLARKRRWPIITAVCAAAAILLTLAALLPGWRAGRRESERQIAALVEAEKRREVMQELNRLWTQVVAAKEWTRQGFRRPEEIRTAFARAEADLNAFIAQNAGLAPAHYVRGRARLYWGAIDGAEADARETVRLDPEIPAGWALLSHVLLRRCLQCLSDPLRPPRAEEEPLAQAVAALRRAGTDATRSAEQRWGIARGPDDEVGDVLIAAFAEAYAYGQATHGAAILAEAMARGNSEEYCRWMGAWTTAPQGRLAWCDRLLAIAPHDAAGYLDRGHARMELGELASAVEDFTRALAIDPELHRARINRAEARFAAGEADAGMLDLAQVIAEARPAEAAAAHFNRSLARSRMRDLTGAIADCSAAVRLRPDFSRAWATRAAFRMRVGDATGAEADCEQALAVDPRCAIAYINRGSLRGNRGNHSGAVADYSAAIEIDPKNAMAWAERGAAHRDIAAYAAAREDASRALELDPACATAYFVRGAARRHLADLDGAIEDLARFVAMESDSAPGWGELGHAKQLKGDREGAASDFKRALSVAPAGWAGRRVMERLLRQVESAGS